MKKKTVELLQRIAITATTVVYGVSFTGNLIALENADAINSALGTASFKTVRARTRILRTPNITSPTMRIWVL